MSEDILKIMTTVDGATRKGVVHRIVNLNDKYKIYEVECDENGEASITLPIGVYSIVSSFKSDTGLNIDYSEVKSEVIVNNTGITGEENILEINITGCDGGVLLDKTCKYFHHDPYWTPNNYDLYFDYNSIPVNIITESPSNLQKRLQNCLPLTKILHLNLDTDDEYQSNSVHIHSNVNLYYNSLNVTSENNNYYPSIYCRWDDDLLEDYYYDYYMNILRNDMSSLLERYELTNSLTSDEYDSLLYSVVDSSRIANNYVVEDVNEESTEDITRNGELEKQLRELFTRVIDLDDETNLIYIAVKYSDPTNTVDIPSLSETGREELINLGEALTGNVMNAFVDRNHDRLYDTYNLKGYYYPITCSIYKNQEIVKDNIILENNNDWNVKLTETLNIYETTQGDNVDYENKPNYSVSTQTPMKYIFECATCGRLYYDTNHTDSCTTCEGTVYQKHDVCEIILEKIDPTLYKNTHLKIL